MKNAYMMSIGILFCVSLHGADAQSDFSPRLPGEELDSFVLVQDQYSLEQAMEKLHLGLGRAQQQLVASEENNTALAKQLAALAQDHANLRKAHEGLADRHAALLKYVQEEVRGCHKKQVAVLSQRVRAGESDEVDSSGDQQQESPRLGKGQGLSNY
jgi:hypothetical protein